MSATSTAGRLVRRHLPFEREFVMIPNAWVRDRRLSWRSRAILTYLMSHQVGWSVTIKSLAADAAGNAARSTDGIASVRKAIGELEQLGYLKREQQRDRGGRLTHTEWVICDPFDPVDNTTPLVNDDDSPETAYPQDFGSIGQEMPDQNRDAIYRRRFEPTSVKTDIGESHDIRTPSLQNTSSTHLPEVTTGASTADVQDRCARTGSGEHAYDPISGYCSACAERRPEPIGAHA